MIFTNEQGYSFPPQNEADHEYMEKCWTVCRGNFPSMSKTLEYIFLTFFAPVTKEDWDLARKQNGAA